MEVTVIKAKAKEKKILKVAAYCRVSVEQDEEESSIANQREHYEDMILNNPDYELAGIYYDNGISGFKENRPGFQKMMEDARSGKIDLIFTKSITRFARNTDTILKATRELKELGIGVFFELQNINTLTQTGELLMTVYAAFAQGESETYRELARLSIRRRFEEGRPLYLLHKAFGYRSGIIPGTFEIVPEEAVVIKQIYKWIREGYTATTILKMAKAAGYHKRSGADFTQSEVYNLIRNEIYKGDYIMQKHITDDNRRHQLNHGEQQSWYIEDDHPAIVSKRLWQEANDVITKRNEETTRHLRLLPMTEENYPYKNKLYCACCGHRLYYWKTKTGAQYSFYCPKKDKVNGENCKGVSVPQKVIESWGEITENIFISFDPDKPVQNQYSYVKESTWKKKHKKMVCARAPKPYTEENYHYYRRLFCEKCGSPLYRERRKDEQYVFVCGGRRRYRRAFCDGMIIPEEVMNRLPKKEGYFILREEIKDGEKHYSYSCVKERPQCKKKPS